MKRYTCNDYRQEMMLAGLRKQLADPQLSPSQNLIWQTTLLDVCCSPKKSPILLQRAIQSRVQKDPHSLPYQ